MHNPGQIVKIHYVYNKVTDAFDDFKFKQGRKEYG